MWNIFRQFRCAALVAGIMLVAGITGAAATIRANDCSAGAVQRAIDRAGIGDTVEIPAGEAIWTEQVRINRKSIRLQGAGAGLTILKDGQGKNRACLAIASCGNNLVSVSGLTLVGSTNSPNNEGWIKVGDKGEDSNTLWRIHDIEFDNIFRSGIKTLGLSHGCIDHCRFTAARGRYNATGVSMIGDGANSWKRPLQLGTTNLICIEDCSFYWPSVQANGAIDAYSGARWLFRYNTVTNTQVGCHGLDSGGYRSPHSFEFYGNSLYTVGTNRVAALFEFRGGTGVIFSNTATSVYPSVTKYMSLTCYRATGSNTLHLGAFPPWGLVTGSNPIDGNTDAYGYPAMDQIGYTTPARAGGPQVSAPLYGWSNTLNGADFPLGVQTYTGKPWFWTNHPNVSDILKEGRDFFNHIPMPGYVPLPYPHPLVRSNL